MRAQDSPIVRRSVALPRGLVDDLIRTAPEELKSNLNRLVIVALQEFIRAQERREFDAAMARMSADPSAQAEIRSIQAEFRQTELDGLSPEESW